MPDSQRNLLMRRAQPKEPVRLTVLVQPTGRFGRTARAPQIVRFAQTGHFVRIERAQLTGHVRPMARAQPKEHGRYLLPKRCKV